MRPNVVLLFAHHHLTKWQPHGGEKSMLAIVQHLRNFGFSVKVMVNNRKTKDGSSEVIDGVEYMTVQPERFEAQAVLELRKKPDVVLTWGMHSHLIAPLCFDANVPCVFFLRYWSPMLQPPYDVDHLEGPIQMQERVGFSAAFIYSSKVICNCEYAAEQVARRWPVVPEVCYVPVDKPESPPVGLYRPFVTLVNPARSNGGGLLLKLAEMMPDVKFQVYGTPERQPPENVTVEPYFNGPYEDMFAKTKVLILPADEVSCGTTRVALEAAYCGVPTVSVNIGPASELLPPHWLVSSNDFYTGWECKVRELYEAEEVTMPDLSRFDAEKSLNKVLGIVENLG